MTEVEIEWGPQGARALADRCDALVLIDVLSFTTAVTVAVRRDVLVWPHAYGAEGAEHLAREIGAVLARGRSSREGPTLSPVSLLDLAPGTRLILPSPNGSAIAHTVLSAGIPVYAACLRNRAAVVQTLAGAKRVGLVPSGERWADGSLRPAYEDWIGAGAIAAGISGAVLSPDAAAAALAFEARQPLSLCPSGIELLERGFQSDVQFADDLDVDDVSPILRNGRFERA